jgi:hypothetical protein
MKRHYLKSRQTYPISIHFKIAEYPKVIVVTLLPENWKKSRKAIQSNQGHLMSAIRNLFSPFPLRIIYEKISSKSSSFHSLSLSLLLIEKKILKEREKLFKLEIEKVLTTDSGTDLPLCSDILNE